jgi:hypothetical protein
MYSYLEGMDTSIDRANALMSIGLLPPLTLLKICNNSSIFANVVVSSNDTYNYKQRMDQH